MTPNRDLDFPLRSIYFYPTESCNLRCNHCWIGPDYTADEATYQARNQDNISVEAMERVVMDAIPLGLNHIKITGGEPFLNPQLFEYLDMFHQHGLSMTFETNGTLLTKDMIPRLLTYNIHQFCTSLDGSRPLVHEKIRGVKGSFQKTVAAIKMLMEHGIYPQVIFCLQKANAGDLENTMRLISDLGVRSFEINPVALLGPTDLQNMSCRGLANDELMALEKRVEEEFPTKYSGMHIDLYLPPALKGINEFALYGLCTCKIHNICGILSNGDVSICGIGRRNKDLILGNVKEQSIVLIWREGEIFKEIRDKIPFELQGICGRCLFRYHCLGFCRADLLGKGLPLTAPYGMCEEVFQMGLFPESRILLDDEIALINRDRRS
ncbi:MAG: radical SAM protein [Deltaproteobacteria bacterium]|nr:radical SAM protein [Deltaproteobacteria bacterium]